MLMVIIAMAGVFATGATISLSITKELRRLSAVLDSVKAFYAADSGTEWMFHSFFKDQAVEKPELLNNTACCGEADLSITAPQKPGDPTRLKSIGTSPVGGQLYIIKRSIETDTNW